MNQPARIHARRSNRQKPGAREPRAFRPAPAVLDPTRPACDARTDQQPARPAVDNVERAFIAGLPAIAAELIASKASSAAATDRLQRALAAGAAPQNWASWAQRLPSN